MMTQGKKCLIWTASGNPYNSIRLQAGLLAEQLRRLCRIDALVVDPLTHDYKKIIKRAGHDGLPLIWEFGGFDKHLTHQVARRPEMTFVYHNITPANFFWRSEPKVALGSLAGKFQLNLLPRKLRWVTSSAFNERQLREMGFSHVTLCPNIVSAGSSSPPPKPAQVSLLFIGRIAPNKRCIELVEQVRLAAEMIEREIRLVMIGRAKPSCRYGKLFAERLGALEGHHWLKVEWIQRELGEAELVEFYDLASLYVSAATHEGFGLPVCEAILRNTPALYLECGGTESILEGHGMVPLNKQREMWRRIAELIDDVECRAGLLKMQQVIVRAYTHPEIGHRIREVYGQWLREKEQL